MKLTPLDIQQQQFRKAFRGFDKKEVAAFLDVVARELERHVREANQLRDDFKRQEAELEEHLERERILKETMISATRISEDIKQNARKEAEIIVAQAEAQADQLIRSAHARLMRITEDIDELRRQKALFESSLRSAIRAHEKLLDATVESDASRESLHSVERMRRHHEEEDALPDADGKVVGMREVGGRALSSDELLAPRGGDR